MTGEASFSGIVNFHLVLAFRALLVWFLGNVHKKVKKAIPVAACRE